MIRIFSILCLACLTGLLRLSVSYAEWDVIYHLPIKLCKISGSPSDAATIYGRIPQAFASTFTNAEYSQSYAGISPVVLQTTNSAEVLDVADQDTSMGGGAKEGDLQFPNPSIAGSEVEWNATLSECERLWAANSPFGRVYGMFLINAQLFHDSAGNYLETYGVARCSRPAGSVECSKHHAYNGAAAVVDAYYLTAPLPTFPGTDLVFPFSDPWQQAVAHEIGHLLDLSLSNALQPGIDQHHFSRANLMYRTPTDDRLNSSFPNWQTGPDNLADNIDLDGNQFKAQLGIVRAAACGICGTVAIDGSTGADCQICNPGNECSFCEPPALSAAEAGLATAAFEAVAADRHVLPIARDILRVDRVFDGSGLTVAFSQSLLGMIRHEDAPASDPEHMWSYWFFVETRSDRPLLDEDDLIEVGFPTVFELARPVSANDKIVLQDADTIVRLDPVVVEGGTGIVTEVTGSVWVKLENGALQRFEPAPGTNFDVELLTTYLISDLPESAGANDPVPATHDLVFTLKPTIYDQAFANGGLALKPEFGFQAIALGPTNALWQSDFLANLRQPSSAPTARISIKIVAHSLTD